MIRMGKPIRHKWVIDRLVETRNNSIFILASMPSYVGLLMKISLSTVLLGSSSLECIHCS